MPPQELTSSMIPGCAQWLDSEPRQSVARVCVCVLLLYSVQLGGQRTERGTCVSWMSFPYYSV